MAQLRDYDADTSDHDFDGENARENLYALVSWTFAPAAETESGLLAWEAVLHTGSNPDTIANRRTAIKRVNDPAERSVELRIPSKKTGTATCNASVRGVFTFGKGPWTTTTATATQTTGTVAVPGINTMNAVGSTPNANAATISVDNKSLTIQPCDATNPGVITTGSQTIPGNKTFTGDVGINGNASVGGDLTVVGNIAAANFGGASSSSPDIILFGGGEDGSLSSGFGTVTLTRDTYYNNVTFNGTDKIICDGWRLFIGGTLDISAAGAGAIAQNGGTGGNASGTTQGSAATLVDFGSSVRSVGCAFSAAGAGSGGSGNNAGLAGGTAVGSSLGGNYNGGITYNGGAGGNGGAQAGGTVIGPTGSPTRYVVNRWTVDISIINQIATGALNTIGFYGAAGGMGGSGGGSSANTRASGAGGGGGGGAPTLWVAAKTIARGTNTTAGIFQCKGGAGGNGSAAVGTNCGGGGGGAGGGGGWFYFTYKTLTGSTITNAIDISGGAGGNGGNGTGTGAGGDGGDAGQSGLLVVFDSTNMTVTRTAWVTPASPGGANSGATAGTGATNVKRVNL